MTPALPNFILLPTSKKSSTSIPDLAVIIPIESTFVTSSYVNVPATVKLLVTVRSVKGPSNLSAVKIPTLASVVVLIPAPITFVNALLLFNYL